MNLSAFRISALIVIMILAARTASAAPVSGAGGYDYWSGPGGEINRSALATVATGLGPGGDFSVTGVRYSDNHIGMGKGAIVGVGLPLAPAVTLRAWGARFLGDESYRAWRLKAGPQIGLPLRTQLGAYYLHYEDDLGGRSDGGVAEVGVPLVANLSARAAASLATLPSNLNAAEGVVGLSWAPVHGLEISGDVGVARNGAIATAPGPAPSLPLGLPPLFGGGETTTTTKSSRTESTFLLGARIVLP